MEPYVWWKNSVGWCSVPRSRVWLPSRIFRWYGSFLGAFVLKNELCASFSKGEAEPFIPTVRYFLMTLLKTSNLDVFRDFFFLSFFCLLRYAYKRTRKQTYWHSMNTLASIYHTSLFSRKYEGQCYPLSMSAGWTCHATSAGKVENISISGW